GRIRRGYKQYAEHDKPFSAHRTRHLTQRSPISSNGVFMDVETQTSYLDYVITVTEANGRFTPRVARPGGMIEHDGHVSEVWAAASCGSLDRAIQTAKAAIDADRIR